MYVMLPLSGTVQACYWTIDDVYVKSSSVSLLWDNTVTTPLKNQMSKNDPKFVVVLPAIQTTHLLGSNNPTIKQLHWLNFK